MECQCDKCRKACTVKPGWFKPGEVAKAAQLLGMDERDFFDKFIAVDWWENTDSEGAGPTYVLAPATKVIEPGTEYPYNPKGECTFFKDGKCQIHKAKPDECRFYDHEKSNDECSENKKAIVKEWRENQAEIEGFLGRKPNREPPTIFDILNLF